jgi:branched-chain amino acid transport system permease protein
MLGLVYGLLGLSMLLVSSVLKLVDLVRGDLAIASAYLAYALTINGNLPIYLIFIPACAIAGVAGICLERFIYRPLGGRPRFTPLVAALGLSLIIQSILQLIFGPELTTYREAEKLRNNITHIGTFYVAEIDILIILVFLLVSITLYVILMYSKFGRAMRAISDDEESAIACGVPKGSTYGLAFFIASVVAGIAGICFGLVYGLEPGVGLLFTVKAFIILMLAGGHGVLGTVLAGMILGISESIMCGLLPANFRDTYIFAILLVILLVRPEGITGRAFQRYK